MWQLAIPSLLAEDTAPPKRMLLRLRFIVWLVMIILSRNIAIGQIKQDNLQVRQLTQRLRSGDFATTYPDSMYFFARQGLEIAGQISDKQGMADMHLFLGIYYSTQGDYSLALQHLDSSKMFYGLVLCKEFVDRNLGRIKVDSAKDQGTTVTFTLPAPIPSLKNKSQ